MSSAEETQWWWTRLSYFASHLCSFLPSVLIGLIAFFFDGTAAQIFPFVIITMGTVSVEVTLGCLRAKCAISNDLEKELTHAGDLRKRKRLASRLRDARIDCAICWFFFIAVCVSWVFIALCEVEHILKLDAGDKFLGKYSHWIGYALSGLNFVIAIAKMRAHATELANEDFPDLADRRRRAA